MAPTPSTLRSIVQIEDDITVALMAWSVMKKKRRRRRWWVHPIHQLREERGTYSNLVNELRFDGEMFFKYFRMTREQFTQLLHYVEKDLTKTHISREVICPRQRLAVTIR